jgi:hypothetical protein
MSADSWLVLLLAFALAALILLAVSVTRKTCTDRRC